jgi:hypothetical protein
MGATAIMKRVIHRPTGIWYWLEVKFSWNVKYYSFDGGETWHKSKVTAFIKAQGSNRLQSCD